MPGGLALGHQKAHDKWSPIVEAALHLLAWQSKAATVVTKGDAARLGLFALRVELRCRAEAAVRRSTVQERLDVCTMALQVRALVDHLFVPEESEPLEPLEDGSRAFVRAPCLSVSSTRRRNWPP